jgi:predicted transcriptional regulator
VRQIAVMTKTIRVSDELHERIRRLGMKGEKYEEIVEKAINLLEKSRK